MPNPNPNEPTYPYGGGTDNPGDNTALPGGPTNFAQTETGVPALALLFPPINGTPGHSDTVLPAGMQAVPPSGAGFDSDDFQNESDTGGVTRDPDGTIRESGQDEVAGGTETTGGDSPAAFPEPNP